MKKWSVKGQTEMSFGMIFSIILIIFFLTFAFFGIKIFLGIQDSAKTTKFLSDMQSDIDKAWRSSQSSQEKVYSLPSKNEEVCFVDFASSSRGQNSGIYDELKRAYYGSENMVFYPVDFEETESTRINNIDLERITEEENPFCIKNVDGKVGLRLTKDLSDALVTLER